MEWKGSNPFCLIIVGEGEVVTLIDLDEPGWIATHHDVMAVPGRWILARKQGSEPVLELTVLEGEEPYYVSRVVHPVGSVPSCPVCGQSMDWDSIEHRSYGIGKKRNDDHVDRLWIMPNGVICGGDDVDRLGHEAVKAASLKMWRSHYASHGGKPGQQEGEEAREHKVRRGRREKGRERRKATGDHGSGDRRSAVRLRSGSGDEDGGAELGPASGTVAAP